MRLRDGMKGLVWMNGYEFLQQKVYLSLIIVQGLFKVLESLHFKLWLKYLTQLMNHLQKFTTTMIVTRFNYNDKGFTPN